jgi:hypothetical protein
VFVTQEAARIKLKNYENALKSFMPFLLGAGLTVIFWDMLGIYHALAEHRELVPEPFPVLDLAVHQPAGSTDSLCCL